LARTGHPGCSELKAALLCFSCDDLKSFRQVIISHIPNVMGWISVFDCNIALGSFSLGFSSVAGCLSPHSKSLSTRFNRSMLLPFLNTEVMHYLLQSITVAKKDRLQLTLSLFENILFPHRNICRMARPTTPTHSVNKAHYFIKLLFCVFD
jgi:hypothetical protein